MTQPIESITVGIADIGDPDPHLDATTRMAARLGATLHVVHAYTLTATGGVAVVAGEESIPETLAALEDAVTQRLRAIAKQAETAQEIVTHATPAPPSEAIIDVAERVRSDVVVVGASERAALPALLLGTTAQRVVRSSTIPVLVVRGNHGLRPERVLLTTDLSAASATVYDDALRLIRRMWDATSLEFRSLFVAGDDVLLPPPVPQIAMRRSASERHRDFLDDVVPRECAVEAKVRLGISAREILAEADEWNAHLLVIGNRGSSGVSRFLIGSVAETVARRASTDVLMIPAGTSGSQRSDGEGAESP